jgi:membrane protease YdiL (CAAX protease family)
MFLIPGWNGGTLWEYVLILFGVSLLMTWAANLARFGILVAITLHLFFNVSAGVLNGVIAKAPTRAHDMLIYTLTVCGSGIAISLIGFRWNRALAYDPNP